MAVLSYGYWLIGWAGSGVLNQPVRVNGSVFTVVGVAPKNFAGLWATSGCVRAADLQTGDILEVEWNEPLTTTGCMCLGGCRRGHASKRRVG